MRKTNFLKHLILGQELVYLFVYSYLFIIYLFII